VLINNELAGRFSPNEDSPIAIVMLGKAGAASQKREESRMQKSTARESIVGNVPTSAKLAHRSRCHGQRREGIEVRRRFHEAVISALRLSSRF